MKTKCRNVNLLDKETIRPWVADCLRRHKNRYDFAKFLAKNGDDFASAVEAVCDMAIDGIRKRNLGLTPVRMEEKLDSTSQKVRIICNESPMQQVYDYIAVNGAMEIFRARLVCEQCSSIPGRGQIYGVKMIKKWVDTDNRSMAVAEKYGYRYTPQCAYFVKLDIRKCYPTAQKDVFLRLFEKECGNENLKWLWRTLLRTHEVNGYTGFAIGALISQWASQYLISYIYRFAKTRGRKRRDRWIPSVTHMCIFMDDMLLMGSNRTQLRKAVEQTIAYTRDELGWEVSPEWHIRELENHDIDMMGFVVHRDGGVTLRSRNFLKLRRQLLRVSGTGEASYRQAQRIVSYNGFIVHSDSRGAAKKYGHYPAFRNAKKVVSKEQRRRRKERGDTESPLRSGTPADRLPTSG